MAVAYDDGLYQQRDPVSLSVAADLNDYVQRAHDFRDAGRVNDVLTILPREEAIRYLRSITRVYTDFDGTILEPGGSIIDPRTQAAICRANSLGVEVVGVTGKPYAEIKDLLNNLEPGFPLHMVFEKGAYKLVIEHGEPKQRYLIATEASEAATSTVKALFRETWKHELEEALTLRSGALVRLEFAGTGTHQCVFSLDILDARLAPPGDAFKDVAGGRNSIKIPAKHPLVSWVKEQLNERVRKIAGFEDSEGVHLGNSNIEWAPRNTNCEIEKDLGVAMHAGLAVVKDPQTGRVEKIEAKDCCFGVMGDSGNDLKLFALQQHSPLIRAFLVYHKDTPEACLVGDDEGRRFPASHFVVPGLANGTAHLELIAAAKEGRLSL